MKDRKLQKYLIKISIMFSIILAATLGFYFFAEGQNEKTAEDINNLKTETFKVESRYKTLQLQLNDSQKAVENYDNFSTSRDGDVQNFRRDFARTLLASLQDRDGIIDLEFSMEPFTKAGNTYERATVALFKSKVTIKFTSDTDIDAFNLIEDISKSFPGNVEILSYDLERKSEISDANLLAIGQGNGRTPFVSGEITFEWQSIQDNLDYKKPEMEMNMKPNPGGPNGGE